MTIYGGDFMGGLTAYIANLSMNMAQQSVQTQFSTGMLKNVMESQEASGNILIESLANMPAPSADGRGTLLDVKV